MTQPQFSRLKKEAQITVIKKEGSFLFYREEAGMDILLYQVNGFYAEVFFAATGNTKINSFEDTAALEVYLGDISLAELYNLL